MLCSSIYQLPTTRPIVYAFFTRCWTVPTELIESILENRHFFVELVDRWQKLKNGISQDSALAPLFLTTNDQPKSEGTCRYIYADYFGVAAQHMDFRIVEERLSNALDKLTPYHEANHLLEIPS